MISSLLLLDRSLFLFLNGLNSIWLDPVMFYCSMGLLWLPLFLVLFYLTIRIFKWKILIILLMVALMITASDQLSNLVKNVTKRPRPTHESILEGKVHFVNGYKGGRYAFYSAHASNTFALAVFLTMLLSRRYSWIPFILFVWASWMSYTRIYLGVHYPSDVLAGCLTGSFLGWLFGILTRRLLIRFNHPRRHGISLSGKAG